MIWPFDRGGLVLALYVATLALHAVFIGYVVAGTAFALLRKDDPIAKTVRDRLPFMLGCGITAGVAPLLFLQLLHQTRFYTANLLLGPRWLAVVPVLIAGFYALYVQKMSDRWRRPALAIALACFVFVAWSWSELHELMQADPLWREFYAAGDRVYLSASVAPRLVVLLGAMATGFAMVAAWSSDGAGRKRLAWLAILSRVISTGGAVWLSQTGFTAHGPALAWVIVLAIAVLVEVGAWAVQLRRPSETALGVATAAGTGALVAAVIVRESPRVALIEPTHQLAADAGGTFVFAIAALLGVAAIAWVVRIARAA
ncbi:MAG: hypothetical protein HOV81_19645 [Kofleriaceae bacterium]|nr:hypothetical protein [Kofleriaceae bacterium]